MSCTSYGGSARDRADDARINGRHDALARHEDDTQRAHVRAHLGEVLQLQEEARVLLRHVVGRVNNEHGGPLVLCVEARRGLLQRTTQLGPRDAVPRKGRLNAQHAADSREQAKREGVAHGAREVAAEGRDELGRSKVDCALWKRQRAHRIANCRRLACAALADNESILGRPFGAQEYGEVGDER